MNKLQPISAGELIIAPDIREKVRGGRFSLFCAREGKRRPYQTGRRCYPASAGPGARSMPLAITPICRGSDSHAARHAALSGRVLRLKAEVRRHPF